MNVEVQRRLEKLFKDYTLVKKGQTFKHFYCPILFRDDDTEICKAHIVNQAFLNAAPHWTIQRKDVDNFYGSNFESDFTALKYVTHGFPSNVLGDKGQSKAFNPKILVDNEPVEHFISRDQIHREFTQIKFEDGEEIVDVVLKISQEETLRLIERNWELEISKDLQIPALVSLIKAAHLSLFYMFGYNYALSTGGHFVGRDILGEFFLQNAHKAKKDVIAQAQTFFQEFVHMARPIQSGDYDYQGTVVDGFFYICKEKEVCWAKIIFVRTDGFLHAVLLPHLNQVDAAAKFTKFIRDKNEYIEADFCQFKTDRIEILQPSLQLLWPK